jgi:hypothetical protein
MEPASDGVKRFLSPMRRPIGWIWMDEEGTFPIERELRQRLVALGPASRAELLRVLNLPDDERADLIGTLYARPRFRTMAELLIDLEENLPSRAIVIKELRIMNRQDG